MAHRVHEPLVRDQRDRIRSRASDSTLCQEDSMGSDKNKDSRRMVTSAFRDRDEAEREYAKLKSHGYSEKDIHLIMSDDTRKRYFSNGYDQGNGHDRSERGNKALEGAAVGGATGGTIGATLTAIAAAGASLAVPGVGLVIAGPLAGALAGGATGAAAGGIVGTLVGMGIPEDRAKVHETDLKDGRIVMGVSPHNDEDATYFEREWGMQG